VEDIVAIKIVDKSGTEHFFLTWGRIFDPVDPEPLLAAVRPNLSRWGVRQARSLEICDSLQDAALEPYFYEALFMMAQERIPFGPKYRTWQAGKRRRVRKGEDIRYVGKKDLTTT
jgi:hypothetical protein